MDPSWNRLSSDLSPQNEWNSKASELSAGGPMLTMEKAWSVSNSNPMVTWLSLGVGGWFVGNHWAKMIQLNFCSKHKNGYSLYIAHTFISFSGNTVNNLTLFSSPRCSMGITFPSSSGSGQTAPSKRIACLVASSGTNDGRNTDPGEILQSNTMNVELIDHS